MVLLLPNVLWYQRLRKYVNCYEQERCYNAELLFEEVDVIFTACIIKHLKIKNITQHFCLNILKSSLIIYESTFFVDKNKLNSFLSS
jgi:hypothetical protein